MIRFARQFFAYALIALLAWAGAPMAVAKGAAHPVGMIVICSGHDTLVVLVDADGQPTQAAHLCPDCGPGLSAVMPFVARGQVATRATITGWPQLAQPVWTSVACVAGYARAPPEGAGVQTSI